MDANLPALLAAFGAGSFLSLLSVVNPPSTLPMYLSLARGYDERERRRMARRACAYCFYILVVTLFVGGFVMQAFGISFGALRVAGGIVVGIFGHGLMYQRERPITADDELTLPRQNPTFFPLAMPGITGPGTMAVVIGISTEIREVASVTGQVVAYATTVAAMALVCIVEWLLLRSAPKVSDRLGPMGIEAMTRLSGFLLICVGVQFIASGIRTLVAGN
ncbi:MAG: MarC family NAAT transporter [Aestuariivirga sp.]